MKAEQVQIVGFSMDGTWVRRGTATASLGAVGLLEFGEAFGLCVPLTDGTEEIAVKVKQALELLRNARLLPHALPPATPKKRKPKPYYRKDRY